MSIHNHPWDDTIAGPRPNSGGTLRRFSSSTFVAAAASLEGIPVARSVTILRPAAADCEPSSPANGPDSPLTPRTPGADWRMPHRRSVAEPRNPTVFDWGFYIERTNYSRIQAERTLPLTVVHRGS